MAIPDINLMPHARISSATGLEHLTKPVALVEANERASEHVEGRMDVRAGSGNSMRSWYLVDLERPTTD
jgi:hypothetical protein